MPLSDLARISKAKIGKLTQHLKKTRYNFADCLKPTYTVPGLLEALLRGSSGDVNFGDICLHLGYSLREVPQPDDIYNVRAPESSFPSLVCGSMELAVSNGKDHDTAGECSFDARPRSH